MVYDIFLYMSKGPTGKSELSTNWSSDVIRGITSLLRAKPISSFYM